MNLHYMQHGNDSEDYTFILPETTTVDEEELEIDIYEVGFTIGALNNEGTVTYTHKDETTQENVLDAQSNSNLQTMLETVVYNIYDTLDTFIESFTIRINDWSLIDDISFKYVMPTTTTTTTTTLPPTEEELNYAETGIYETNARASDREAREAEEARVNAARMWERDKNLAETGILGIR